MNLVNVGIDQFQVKLLPEEHSKRLALLARKMKLDVDDCLGWHKDDGEILSELERLIISLLYFYYFAPTFILQIAENCLATFLYNSVQMIVFEP
ncbi:hypothetical protein ACJX0J_016324 [Zea mays]